jgi:hypothetical protein
VGELVTLRKPILETLPRNTRWLVLHGLYITAPGTAATANATPNENDVSFEISCYGDMGCIISGLATGEADFDHRMAKYTTVRDWFSAKATSNIGSTESRVIVSASFKGTSSVPII